MSQSRKAGSLLNRRRSDKTKRVDASEVLRRKKTEVLIDGYNLLHVTRFKPVGRDDGELRRCRESMLAMLADRLPSAHYRRVTLVFDSDRAPSHLDDQYAWRHLHVLFARDQNSADDLIARLIRQHPHPKQLVVVSSDHRIQVVADRRKAIAVDSEDWWDALLETDLSQPLLKKATRQERDEMTVDELDRFRADMSVPIPDEPDEPRDTVKTDEPDVEVFENPFPEGYFDDIDDV